MRLTYLPANQAWAFVMGDIIVSIDGHSIFTNMVEAINAANRAGLTVRPDGWVLAS